MQQKPPRLKLIVGLSFFAGCRFPEAKSLEQIKSGNLSQYRLAVADIEKKLRIQRESRSNRRKKKTSKVIHNDPKNLPAFGPGDARR